MDPLAATRWSDPSTVDGFARGQPNPTLMAYAAAVLGSRAGARALDVGCGAGRNAVPLALAGWHVVGTDLSWPMLVAARAKASTALASPFFAAALAPMDRLPIADRSVDLIIAHGIWNLATSDAEFRRAIREAARVARPGAAMFVFTFSRHTLPAEASPVPGETLVFTGFAGRPQCFVTDEQLLEELSRAGFRLDPTVPFVEHNRPVSDRLRAAGTPVIYEAAFRHRGPEPDPITRPT